MVLRRLQHIKTAIAEIRPLLAGYTYDQLMGDGRTRLAYQRLLEIVSEAARNVPPEWRQSHGADIPWPQVVAIGNILRHAYHRIDYQMLWQVYQHDLDPLERAIDAMIAAYGPTP